MEIKNTEVFGLERSARASGLPMRLELHSDESLNKAVQRIVRLGKMGNGHSNALKGILVTFDIKLPHYLMIQAQRYHWWEIVSSQSKMHRITRLPDISEACNSYVDQRVIDIVNDYISTYNGMSDSDTKREYFHKIISNTPLGFELWQEVQTNYLQLVTIYKQRRNHKLSDWKYLCDWIEGLPFMRDILGVE